MAHVNDPEVLERLLRTPARWAIVGLTTNEWRAAYGTSLLVRDRLGMEIIPVNLPGNDVHGETGYARLADIPAAGKPVDVVNCFVNSHKVGAVVDQAIAIGAGAVWLQLGVINEPAAARAKAAGGRRKFTWEGGRWRLGQKKSTRESCSKANSEWN